MQTKVNIIIILQTFLNITGVKTWVQWASWYIHYVLVSFVTVIGATVVLSYPVKLENVVVTDGVRPVNPQYSSVAGHVQPVVLFLVLFTFSIALVSYCILLSAFFNSGKF